MTGPEFRQQGVASTKMILVFLYPEPGTLPPDIYHVYRFSCPFQVFI